MRRIAARAAAALAALALSASAAATQEVERGAAETSAAEPAAALGSASPSLPESHWAVRAAWRAEAMGLVPRFLPAQRAVPRAEVARALREAALRAPEVAPWAAPLVEAWWARFREEFSEVRDTTASAAPALLGSRAYAGGGARVGAVSPGMSLRQNALGPTPLADTRGAAAGVEVGVRVAPWLSLLVEPAVGAEAPEWRGWDAIAAAGPLRLAVGRQPVGYGEARGGGVVLSEGALPRVEFATARPLFGAVSLHAALSRFDEPRHGGHPFFLAARLAVRPHPRLTLAINRATIFAGDSVDVPLTAWNFTRMMVGVYKDTYAFDNQVVSVSGRVRLPTERLLPLALYAEWGADDAAGAWRDVPARTVGLALPALPAWPAVDAGLEYTRFAASCCGNPEWYRHGSFPGNWATHDRPLGHPLGGEGREWRLYGGVEALGARVRVDAEVVRRRRGAENLFAPERAGRSQGVRLGGAWRVRPGAELEAGWLREVGRGWNTQAARILGVVFF